MNMDGKNLLVRVFNAEGDAAPRRIAFEGHADKVELIGLDGQVVRPLQRKEKGENNRDSLAPSLSCSNYPLFGVFSSFSPQAFPQLQPTARSRMKRGGNLDECMALRLR